MQRIYIHQSWEKLGSCADMKTSFIYKHLSIDNRLAVENNAGFIHKATTVGTVACDWSSAQSRTITVAVIVSRLQRRVKSVRSGDSDWLKARDLLHIIISVLLVHSKV